MHVCFYPTQNPSVNSLGAINGVFVVIREVETWLEEGKDQEGHLFIYNRRKGSRVRTKSR